MPTIHPRTPEQITESFQRKRLSLAESAAIPACKRLCSYWHNRLGGCYRLDNERLRALCRRLILDRIPEAHLCAAFDAYSKECQTSVDRAKKGIPPRTLVSFLDHDGLESWIERGLAAQSKAAAVRERSSASAQADAEKRVIMQAIARAAAPLGVTPEHHFGTVLRQAYLELSAEDPQVGSTFNDPRIRARMLAITKRTVAAGAHAGRSAPTAEPQPATATAAAVPGRAQR